MFDLVFAVFLITFSIVMIGLVIYALIKKNKFLKQGVPVKMKVIDIQSINTDENIPVRLQNYI